MYTSFVLFLLFYVYLLFYFIHYYFLQHHIVRVMLEDSPLFTTRLKNGFLEFLS